MRAALLSLIVILLPTADRAFAQVPPKPKYELVLQSPPSTSVDSVRVSPDGSLVASATGEGGVRLHDRKTGNLIRVMGGVGDRGVCFSPDGQTITAAGFHMDKLVALWDVRSAKRLRTFEGQTEWEADATAISPDGKLLASTGTDKQILVWDIATGKLRLQLKNQPARLAAIAFSPDSATLATAGGDKTIRIWDCTSGQLRRALEGQGDWICALAFAPDGKSIASGSCDWGFHRGHDWPRPPERGVEQWEWRLWDVASRKAQRTERGPGRLLSLAIAPDGASLACGVGREVRLYALAADAPARVIATHDADVTSVAFTPDGAAIVSGSHDQTVRCAQAATGQVEWIAPGHFDQVDSVALPADGSLLVTGSSDWRFARGWMPASAKQAGPGAVRIWDARTGRLIRRLGDPAEQVMAVAISADGRRLAAGAGIAGGKGAVHVWDANTGALIWTATDHDREVLAVAFAIDGGSLAAGSADGLVKIRDTATGAITRTLPAAAHLGGATAILFAPDAGRLYVGQGAGGTRIWDARTGNLLQTSGPSPSRPASFTVDRLFNSIALTADGTTLAMCGSSTNSEYVGPLWICDARNGILRRDFSAENIHGRPMALSPDGAVIATGGKSVKLWDARTGKLLRELFGHLKRTQSIAFSADGSRVVAGGSYGTTNVWDVASGELLVTLFTFPNLEDATAPDDWLAYNPAGYYAGSPGVETFLAWRVGDELQTPAMLTELHDPARVAAALAPTAK